jgi:23S rRNA pseudouridine1911/1915/1917 synthase
MENIQVDQAASTQILQVAAAEQGTRLDIFITAHFPLYTRSFFQRLIGAQQVTINGHKVTKQGLSLKAHDIVQVEFPSSRQKRSYDIRAHTLGVRVIYEHEHFLVIDKPTGLNVHPPSTHHAEPSLVDWLIATYEKLDSVGYQDRPGIVHRLDKDTSGIMLVARTNYGHALLADQFKQRTIRKTYLALVQGHPATQGTIDLAIVRHPTNRRKMLSIAQDDPRMHLDHAGVLHLPGAGRVRLSLSMFRVIQYFPTTTLLEVKPTTGRTHQIRVHCAGIGHPLVGDHLYGVRSCHINHQALHAHELTFTFNGTHYEFKVDLPEELKKLLTIATNSPI